MYINFIHAGQVPTRLAPAGIQPAALGVLVHGTVQYPGLYGTVSLLTLICRASDPNRAPALSHSDWIKADGVHGGPGTLCTNHQQISSQVQAAQPHEGVLGGPPGRRWALRHAGNLVDSDPNRQNSPGLSYHATTACTPSGRVPARPLPPRAALLPLLVAVGARAPADGGGDGVEHGVVDEDLGAEVAGGVGVDEERARVHVGHARGL